MGLIRDFILKRKFVLREIYKAYVKGLDERRVTDICVKLSLEKKDGECIHFEVGEVSLFDSGVESMNREIHDANLEVLVRQTVTKMIIWWNRNKDKSVSDLIPQMEKGLK